MISGIIHTTLGSLVSNRVYPNTFLQPPNETLPTWPAIRYQILDGDAAPDICGTTDVLLDDAEVQIDVVAKTYGAAAVLRDQVIAALRALTDPPSIRRGLFETYDSETKTHRVILRYLFSPSSAFTGSPTTP